MRILYINKYFHIVGGVEKYFFSLAELMKEKGHKIAFFSMTDPQNLHSDWNRYFVSNVSYSKNSFSDRMRLMIRIFYSVEARQKLKKILADFKPDIVHIHDIYHQISPSIIPEIAKSGIPMVQTLGNYHLISPNYSLFHNGKICEISKQKKFYKALFHRCVKNSYAASLIEVAEKYLHNKLGWERNMISKYIVPSLFLRNKLVEFGISGKKIVVIPHFVNSVNSQDTRFGKKGLYLLYFGRLTEEKGLKFLLQVMEDLPQIKLKIVGDGYLKCDLEEIIRRKNLKNIKLLGFKSGRKLSRIIRDSRFSILPSLWYEVFGLSIIESFAQGRTVLASRIGGIPEIIKDRINGLLFNPGDLDDCRGKILRLWQDERLLRKLETHAYLDAKKLFSAEEHYFRIVSLYQELIKEG